MKKNLLNRQFVYRFSIFISGILPLWLYRAFAKSVAFLCYIFFTEERKNVERNLSHIYNDSGEIRGITKRVFRNYGLYIADWARLNLMDTKEILDLFGSAKGREFIEEGLRRGKGIILLTVHLSNWELGGLFFSHSGIPVNVVTAQDEVVGIANVREQSRKIHNVKTITIRKDPLFTLEIINALKRNEIVAILMDRYTEGNGVLIDFFGKPVSFPPGPVLLAKITGAVVIPGFIVCGPDNRYEAIADSIINMDFSEDREKDIKENLKKIIKVLEKYIIKYSDQWYNFTYLWKDTLPQNRE